MEAGQKRDGNYTLDDFTKWQFKIINPKSTEYFVITAIRPLAFMVTALMKGINGQIKNLGLLV